LATVKRYYGVLKTEGAYLVMELVRGETLGSILKREQRLSPEVAAEWLDQTLAAVEAPTGRASSIAI